MQLPGLWRSRAALAGLLAIALAVWGEALMRGGPGQPAANAVLGTNLMRVAVLLVGLVAWVRDGRRLRARPAAAAESPGEERAPGRGPPKRLGGVTPQGWTGRVAAARARAGWAGTAIGVLIVVALAAWCLLLLNQNFSDARAPWVWLAALGALTLTFLGAEPRPVAAGLVPTDPNESPDPPTITRHEWLAIGAILLIAAVLRLWSLDAIPLGPSPDEGDRALDARHINRGEPVNGSGFLLFGTGWWGVPSLYFWLVAQALKVFGDNLAGARMIHALAGIGTVWYTYRLGRAVWSPRAGLLAGALLAISDLAIQFSRTAGESTITMFTWTVCCYYLYRALQTRQPLNFVLSGLAGGFTLYGYVAGKLLPVSLALVALYLLVRWGRTGVRRYLPGLVLLALTAGLVFAPNGLYILQHPDTLTQRYNGVSIFTADNANRMQGAYATTNWAAILAGQFGLTYSAFDVGQERGPFYPTGQPILPVPWAALWVLGGAYVLWRAGDVRFAVLGLWILSGLAGAALTNETPSLQRVGGMVPALALVPAVFLDRLARGIPTRHWAVRPPARAALTHWAMGVLAGLLVLTSGVQTVSYYFGPYTARANYYWYTLAGRYAANLDPARNVVYEMDVPEFNWAAGPALFLADKVAGRDLPNVASELPLTTDEGQTAHFLVYPSNQQYLATLQTYYPGGQQHVVNRPDGRLFFTDYAVAPAQFDARRQMRARYGPPAGPLFERQEPRLGTLGDDAGAPPAGMTYPLGAEWRGGLRVPVYGTYRFHLTAPDGARLTIDGRVVLTSTAGSSAPVETRVVLAAGVHEVQLAGTLGDAQTPIALRWSTDTGILVPIGRPFLWSGPLGTLLGRFYAPPSAPTWLKEPQPPVVATLPVGESRDGVLGWRMLNGALNGTVGVWTGTLHAPVAGLYGIQAVTDAQTTLWIDGRLLDASSGGQIPALPAAFGVQLTAGEHTFELHAQVAHAGTTLDVVWAPPDGKPEVLAPAAFLPPTGGVYSVAERPSVPSPDPRTIGAAPPLVQVRIAGTIRGDWQEARGVAVLPDGRVVVGDTGHHRLLVYGADGQLQRAWGSAGQGAGHFAAISDVAASADGVIATLDAGNSDIQLFDGDGTPHGHLQAAQLGLSASSRIAWGPDGQIYVADTAGARVLQTTVDGRHVTSLREGDGRHAGPDQALDVVVTSAGTVYAVDLRRRILRFNRAGQVDQEWAVPVGPLRGGSHLALWGNSLAITEPNDNTIALLDLGTGLLHTLAISGPSAGLAVPVGVAVGPDQRLYVLDSANNRVVILERVP